MSRPRILVFSTIYPLPIDRGDKNRLYHVLDLLTGFAEVRFVALRRDWEPAKSAEGSLPYDITVAMHPIRRSDVLGRSLGALVSGHPPVAQRFGTREVRHFVRDQIARFGPMVFWGFQISAYPFLRLARETARVLDLVDSPSRFARLAAGAPSVRDRIASRLTFLGIDAAERGALEESDVTLLNSRLDIEHIRSLHGESVRIQQLDNCVPDALLERTWHCDRARPARLLFVGNMAYAPNASAVRSFVREILPRIQENRRDAEFIVCGEGSRQLGEELGRPAGVRCEGFVKDLTAMYLAASVLVVPVPMAGGLQYKLLEGMAHGVPVVASPSSAAAGGMRDGREVLVGETPENFASAILRLLNDPALAAALSAGARAFIKANHIWETKGPLLESFVSAAMQRASGRFGAVRQ